MDNGEITLRPFQIADKHQLAKLANNKKIYDNVRDHFPFPYSQDDAEAFIKRTRDENPRQTFAIVYDGDLCGGVGLLIQEDVYRKSAEIGYWIGEPYWGKGITSKAVALLTEYGFNDLNLLRIYAGVFDFNVGSMKVLEKNGFVKEGVFKNAVIKNGRICDEHRYCKLKESKKGL